MDGYRLLIFLLCAIGMLAGVMILGLIEKYFFEPMDENEEEDDAIYIWEI